MQNLSTWLVDVIMGRWPAFRPASTKFLVLRGLYSARPDIEMLDLYWGAVGW